MSPSVTHQHSEPNSRTGLTKLFYKCSFVAVLYYQTIFSLANAPLAFPSLACMCFCAVFLLMRLPWYVQLMMFQWFIYDSDWCKLFSRSLFARRCLNFVETAAKSRSSSCVMGVHWIPLGLDHEKDQR